MIADIFRMSDDEDLTDDRIREFIKKNDEKKYAKLWRAYSNDHDIYTQRAKPQYKPDNRLSVNFPKYIVDTFIGFSYGINIGVDSPDNSVRSYISDLNARTSEDDILPELATIAAIFGRAYRIIYVDEAGDIGTAVLDPRESFMIYNESIKPKPRYFIRYYTDSLGVHRGSIADETYIQYFHIDKDDDKLIWDDSYIHGFETVPAVELVMNQSRHGIFEDVLPLCNSYNKVLSEKADDVEYFSDSYIKILGAALDEETIRFMRENRVINLAGKAGAEVTVDFLQRPSADDTQEHLLDRLERQIFTIAMICNISDDNFAASSGIAIRYKMVPMVNLANAAWRKMALSLDEYYQIVCSSPLCPVDRDAWTTLVYSHTLNFPVNLSDEAEVAAKLDGIISKRAQLGLLSIIDDVDVELQRIREDEESEADIVTPYLSAGGNE